MTNVGGDRVESVRKGPGGLGGVGYRELAFHGTYNYVCTYV